MTTQPTAIGAAAAGLAGKLAALRGSGHEGTRMNAGDVASLRTLLAELYRWRDFLDARERALWREEASRTPDMSAFTRIRIADDDPDMETDAVLVERTDLGLYFMVSTNDRETYTFAADAAGSITSRQEIRTASAEGMSRAWAFARLDAADPADLVPVLS